MKELSNSTLAMLVVITIIVSVSGTLISLSKLSQFGGGAGVTGMISSSLNATGEVNLTVQSTTYINATDNVIELGVIDPGSSGTSESVNDWFNVRNDGSVNITIRIYSHPDVYVTDEGALNQSGSSGTSYLSGRGPFTSDTVSEGCLNRTTDGDVLQACFMVKCQNSTYTDAICNSTYEALPLSNVGPTSRKLIEYLAPTPDNINDSAIFGVNVTVPTGEPAGVKRQYVNLYASAS